MASLEAIRSAAAGVTRRGRGHAYPKSLQRQVVKYALAQRAAGIPIEKIGEEVGVPWRTIRRWLSDARRGRFHAVEIAAQPHAELVVHGPHGIRVEGLDLDSVAELLRRLA